MGIPAYRGDYEGGLPAHFARNSFAVAGGRTTLAAAAVAERTEDTKPDAKLAEGKRRPLQTLLQGANPEERGRLEAERTRLSAAAKAFGTDPTAINGYYELTYGKSAFTNNLRLDTAVAEVRLPITPNWNVRMTMPYVFANLNQARGFTTNGASDFLVRTGSRLYASENVALFVGTDVTFPTGSNDRLSTGKYTLGPGGAVNPSTEHCGMNCSTANSFTRCTRRG